MLRQTTFACMAWVVVLCCMPAQAAEPMVFDLTWQASSSGCSLNIQPDVQTPFAVEPDFRGRDVVRGLLPCAPAEDRQIAFVWDFEQKRLYVDLNGNRDLTDDPNGVYTSITEHISYQPFRDIKVEVARDMGVYAYHLSIDLSRYTARHTYCYVSVRSGFEAQIDAAGQAYRVQIVDNLDGRLDRSDTLHITPLKPGMPTARLSMPQRISLAGRLYDCQYAWVTDANQPKARLTLTEQETDLGQLTIAGQGIEYLELQAQHVVPIFEPNQATLSLPVGDYRCTTLTLQSQAQQQMYVQNLDQHVTVKVDEPAILKLGGPLKSVVTVNRANKCLTLNVKIVGQGGEQYRTSGTRDTAPRFTVYKGDTQIHSGQFEYG